MAALARSRSVTDGIPDDRRVRAAAAETLRSGGVAGMVVALVLVTWWTVLDLAVGSELTTFGRIAAAVLEGVSGAAGADRPTPGDVATGMLFLLIACTIIGALVAWLLSRFPRTPSVGLRGTVAFAALQLAFFALDGASRADLFAALGPWAVLVGNALAAAAMTFTLVRRQPRLIEGRRDLWDEEP